MADNKKGSYNKDRKGFETVDGGLIRIHGKDSVRIDIYKGDERKEGEHSRDTIRIDTNTGKGKIDQHNEDKTKFSSTDTQCFLTTACMRFFKDDFKDDCYELNLLRWFRDNFVSEDDINYYYNVAPLIVSEIENSLDPNLIYNYIYETIILYCVFEIELGNYENAYTRYKEGVVYLESEFLKPLLQQKLIRCLKKVGG